MFIPTQNMLAELALSSNVALGTLILGFVGFLFLLRSERISFTDSPEKTEKEIQTSIRLMGAKIGALQRIERTLGESGLNVSDLELKITPYPELRFNTCPKMGTDLLCSLFYEALDTDTCFLLPTKENNEDENGIDILFSIKDIGIFSLDLVQSRREDVVSFRVTVSQEEG